jgi:mono/diheme cytochrome c family protein
MPRLWWFMAGAFSLGIVLLILAALWISQARGFSASQQPTASERWVAQRALSAALPRDAVNRPNPIPSTPEVLSEARAHWADHCALCHANDGSGNTTIGMNTYPPAPDMRLPATQSKTDGELFYIIQNGIRLSAMPAWGSSGHTEEDSWKLVDFIRHLPQVTLEEKKAMEKLNPKSPEELKEEEEEERFLKGEDANEPQNQHHHH